MSWLITLFTGITFFFILQFMMNFYISRVNEDAAQKIYFFKFQLCKSYNILAYIKKKKQEIHF